MGVLTWHGRRSGAQVTLLGQFLLAVSPVPVALLLRHFIGRAPVDSAAFVLLLRHLLRLNHPYVLSTLTNLLPEYRLTILLKSTNGRNVTLTKF